MEWKEIRDTENLNEFMRSFGYFHDSCLKELHMWSEHYVHEDLSMYLSSELDHKVRILFQRQDTSPSAIELMFEEVTEINIIPSPQNYDSLILKATFIYCDGMFYWADIGGWKPEQHSEKKASWLSAKKVSWRDVSQWMGKELRYGTRE
jgi:hypothetical protein